MSGRDSTSSLRAELLQGRPIRDQSRDFVESRWCSISFVRPRVPLSRQLTMAPTLHPLLPLLRGLLAEYHNRHAVTAEHSLLPQTDNQAQLEVVVEVFDLRVWVVDAERLVVRRPLLCFIANEVTIPQDRCKRYAAFAMMEGEEVNSEGQVEAVEWEIVDACDFLKKIDDACTEWAKEVEKAQQEAEAEEMWREEAAQVEAFRKNAAVTAAVALAACAPTLEEHRRSEEVW